MRATITLERDKPKGGGLEGGKGSNVLMSEPKA